MSWGWGGWWFWDPVENASLMPWLAATALLHSVAVLAVRDALRAWTVMLALVAFAMSMAGTFLVRSGILTSVHAFAVDPERGAFILALLLIYIGGALALFGLRIGSVREGKQFALLSREGGIVANNIFLSVILAIVLVGTLWPLAAEAMGDKISVGPPYFNRATVPLGLLLMLALAVGPLLRWRSDDAVRLRRLIAPALTAVAALILLFMLKPRCGDFSDSCRRSRGGACRCVFPAADRSQPDAHAADHMGHGTGAFRSGGQRCRYGRGVWVVERAAGGNARW